MNSLLETDLRILCADESRSHLPAFCARGCQQSLSPLHKPNLKRGLNGVIVDVSFPIYKKYGSTIKGDDLLPLALETLGPVVKVGCICPLTVPCQPTQLEILLERPAVEGSVFFQTQGKTVPIACTQGKVVLPSGHSGGYIIYAPWLVMRIISCEITTQEWDMRTSWTVVLEEV